MRISRDLFGNLQFSLQPWRTAKNTQTHFFLCVWRWLWRTSIMQFSLHLLNNVVRATSHYKHDPISVFYASESAYLVCLTCYLSESLQVLCRTAVICWGSSTRMLSKQRTGVLPLKPCCFHCLRACIQHLYRGKLYLRLLSVHLCSIAAFTDAVGV